MARRSQPKDEDDLIVEDELAAAFLDEEEQPLVDEEDDQPEMPVEAHAEEEWDEEETVPGQLAVDIYETKDKLYVKARVAGVNKPDLDVSITDNELTIRGTLSSGEEIETENYYVQEIYWGEFSRTVNLPVSVKEDEVDAVLKDGVLTIGFTKLKQDSVKKIEIK